MSSRVRAIFLNLFIFLATCDALRRNDYEVPTPVVQALDPRGFKVTLPDDGYSFFGFRGNINKDFPVLNEGEIKRDVVKPKGGMWIYKNLDAELQIGDIIYYWIYVIKNGKGYMKTDLDYTVTEFVKEGDAPKSAKIVPLPTTATPDREIPDREIPTPKPELDNKFETTEAPCPASKTMVQGRKFVCKDSLIFNEEFDKTSLNDLGNWDAEIKFPHEPDYPYNVYIPDQTVSFESGSFVITPVLTESHFYKGYIHETLDLNARCTGVIDTCECKMVASGAQILPPVVTAKITTRRTFNFKFGRVEVRAKLPSGDWVLPEINLEPTGNEYGSDNYKSGLMRIVYAPGNPSLAKKLYGGPVLFHNEPFRSMLLKEKIGIDNWNKDFHNYTMIWRPDGIDLLVDGEQYGTINPGAGFYETARRNGVKHASHWLKGTIMAPLDQMFHLTLGLRVGGVKDFSDDLPDKPWRNSAGKAMLNFWRGRPSWLPTWYNGAMKVDYVRVYAL